jgi:thymidylate kinase
VWDRYQPSNEVHFVVEGGDWSEIERLRDSILGENWPRPDLEIVFRVNPEECMRRLAETGKQGDYFETKEFLEKLCAGYEEYLKKHPEAVGINATQSIKSVAEDIETAVLRGLAEWRSASSLG